MVSWGARERKRCDLLNEQVSRQHRIIAEPVRDHIFQNRHLNKHSLANSNGQNCPEIYVTTHSCPSLSLASRDLTSPEGAERLALKVV